MGLFFNYDYWNNLETPSFVLCNVNKDRIGILRVSDRNLHYNNEIPEISFKIMKFIDGKENPYYDKVLPLQYIYLENIGYFQITKKPITITSESIEYKQVTAQSSEIEFGQKYINTFTINMGTVESIDGVCLYQVGDEEHSLLNLVLEKIPSWSVGYVDPSIATLQRSFEIDNQDIYSFLTEDAAEAFGCIFVFNTLNNTVNVYDKDKISEDTNIIVSFKNLLKEVQIEPDIDSIKTCLTLIGEDDLTIRELNMGYDRIYNFDYFANTDYMSEDLIEAYNKYKENFEKYRVQYTKLITQYQNLIIEIAKLDHEMLPETPLPKKDDVLITTQELADNKEVWKEYCLTELNTYKKAYEGRQSVLMQKGYGDTSKSEYNTLYLPVYTIIKNINDEISIRESQIKTLEDKKLDLNIQMQAIIDIIDIQNNFTKEQWLYLSKLIREDTITDSNYVVTDTMTQEETLEMQQAFLDYGNEQMNKVSQPQFTFTLDMANIFAIPEFRDKLDKFSLFNYIMVSIRDDYNIKAKILSFDINFEDKKDFSVTFGSIYKYKNSDIFSTAVDAMATASSASTSVSFNKFQWNNASNDSLNIKDMISSGLISAGANLINSKSTMEIDERGLFMNNDSESSYPNDRAALTGSNLLFTSDGWKTVRTALGRFSYTKSDGTVVNTYGLVTDTVLSGYIGGSLIEGNTINGNNIVGNNITGGTIKGTHITNGNGTFDVDENGIMKASSATVTGNITATNLIATQSGKIGCWEITNSALYNGIAYTGAQDSNSCGIGTYGGNWAFWAGNGKFSVTQDGALYSKNANIEGKIVSNDITATNGTFTNVTIGKNCNITGDCYIDGRVWGAGFSINSSCGFDARTLGSGFTWNGNAVGSSFLDGTLTGKTLRVCVTSGSLGIGSSSNYVDVSSGNTVIGSSSGVLIKTSGSTPISVAGTKIQLSGAVSVSGSFSVSGSKNRIIKEKHFGEIPLGSYETPLPMFGDIGTGYLDENGELIIWINPIFKETIESKYKYIVFLTKYSEGNIWVDLKNSCEDYFIVKGTPNIYFGWELKSVQKDMLNTEYQMFNYINYSLGTDSDYEHDSDIILQEYEGGIEYAV